MRVAGSGASVELYLRIRNRNECHRVTTDLMKRFGLIVMEDLRIRNMTRSAAGTLEKPGRNVRQKSGLNRSIAEQTWSVMRQQISYKAVSVLDVKVFQFRK